MVNVNANFFLIITCLLSLTWAHGCDWNPIVCVSVCMYSGQLPIVKTLKSLAPFVRVRVHAYRYLFLFLLILGFQLPFFFSSPRETLFSSVFMRTFSFIICIVWYFMWHRFLHIMLLHSILFEYKNPFVLPLLCNEPMQCRPKWVPIVRRQKKKKETLSLVRLNPRKKRERESERATHHYILQFHARAYTFFLL